MPATAVIRRRGIALAIAVSATLLASGCGSGGGDDGKSTDSAAAGTDTLPASDTAPASESDSNGDLEEGGAGCDLISDEVAASVLGVDIVRREPQEDPTTGGVSCTKGNELGTFVLISVTPGGAALVDEASSEADSVAVPGVGDRAEYVADAALFIASGADLVTVQVSRGGVPGSLDDCLTVAEDVLSNL